MWFVKTIIILAVAAFVLSSCTRELYQVHSSKYKLTVKVTNGGATTDYTSALFAAKSGARGDGERILVAEREDSLQAAFQTDDLVVVPGLWGLVDQLKELVILVNLETFDGPQFTVPGYMPLLQKDTVRIATDNSVGGWRMAIYSSQARPDVRYFLTTHLFDQNPNPHVLAVLGSEDVTIDSETATSVTLAIIWKAGQSKYFYQIGLPSKPDAKWLLPPPIVSH